MRTTGDQLAAVSVVVVGQFNPSIAQPAWLASEGLIPKAVAEGATLDVIHPEVSDFTLPMSEQGAVLRVQVLRERLHVSTEDARLYETARDLAIGILTLLRHTPVNKLGINFDSHVPMASEADRNALGHLLAPPSSWTGVLEKPAMLSLSMKGARTDGEEGHIVVKVEASVRVPFGVFVAVNDHFEGWPASGGAEKVVDLLRREWDTSIKRSREVVAKVVSR